MKGIKIAPEWVEFVLARALAWQISYFVHRGTGTNGPELFIGSAFISCAGSARAIAAVRR